MDLPTQSPGRFTLHSRMPIANETHLRCSVRIFEFALCLTYGVPDEMRHEPQLLSLWTCGGDVAASHFPALASSFPGSLLRPRAMAAEEPVPCEVAAAPPPL